MKKTKTSSRREHEDAAISGKSLAAREKLRQEYAEAEAKQPVENAERFQWVYRSEDKHVGVITIDGDHFLWRALSNILFQLTLLRFKVSATYDVWCGGRTDECGCGREKCKHLEAVRKLK